MTLFPFREKKRCLYKKSVYQLKRTYAYVSDRFLAESRRLIADIIETCDLEQVERYLVAADFEKLLTLYAIIS